MTTGSPGTEAVGGDDHFTPAEAAFFESGGAKADGLFEPAKVEPATVTEPDKGAAVAKPAAKTEAEPGEVEIADDGRVRDAKTGRFVPLPVLQKEREEHKTTKRERDELRAKWDGIIAKFDGVSKAADPAKAEPAKAPEMIDPEKDLIGGFKQQSDRVAALEKKLAEQSQTTAQQIERVEAERLYEREKSEFAKTKPDFEDARQHALTVRAAMLIDMQPDVYGTMQSPNVAAIMEQLKSDEDAVRASARAQKKSQAEMLYQIAQRYGYAAKTNAAATNGATEKPTVNGKTPAEEVVERIEKGQEGARTLSGAGGGEASGLTMEQFLAMDDLVIASRMQTDPSFKRSVNAIMGKR